MYISFEFDLYTMYVHVYIGARILWGTATAADEIFE